MFLKSLIGPYMAPKGHIVVEFCRILRSSLLVGRGGGRGGDQEFPVHSIPSNFNSKCVPAVLAGWIQLYHAVPSCICTCSYLTPAAALNSWWGGSGGGPGVNRRKPHKIQRRNIRRVRAVDSQYVTDSGGRRVLLKQTQASLKESTNIRQTLTVPGKAI